MADEETQTESQAKAKKPVGLILTVALVALVAGAGGSFFLANRLAVLEGPRETAGGGAAGSEQGREVGNFQERLLSLDPIVVNVTSDGYARLLKLSVDLECDSVGARDEAELRISQIRDAIVGLVSSKRLADVTDFEGKALLKEELRDRISRLLEAGSVQSVLFTDFVVQ